MKPITSKTDLTKLLADASVLMLKSNHEGIRYLTQLLASPSSTITSKAGIFLPNELWNKIVSLAVEDTTLSFCLVQITSIQGKLLRCREIDRENLPIFGELASRDDVHLLELLFDEPDATSTCLQGYGLPDIPSEKRCNTFEVLITPHDDESRESAILFHDIKVPDIIAIWRYAFLLRDQ